MRGAFLAAIMVRNGASWIADALPIVSHHFAEIAANASTSQAAPFWTLISAKNAAFTDPFQPPPVRAGYYPKFGGLIAAIIFQKGASWDVDGLSATPAKSWKNHGRCVENTGDPILRSNRG